MGPRELWLWKPADCSADKRPDSGLLDSDKDQVLLHQVRKLHWWNRTRKKPDEKLAKQLKTRTFKLKCMLFSHEIRGIIDGNVTHHLNINAM